MNKIEAYEAVAKSTGVEKKTVHAVLEGFLELTSKLLKKGDSITLPGFGKFEAVRRAARKGVNPSTGESLKIPARKAVRFKVGAELKRTVNG